METAGSVDSVTEMGVGSPVENMKSAPSILGDLIKQAFKVFPMAVLDLHDRAIHRIETWENRLDHLMPTCIITDVQDNLDKLGVKIKDLFAPIATFNRWLDDHGHGNWYKLLAIFLMKLPLRAARNILRLLYNTITAILYAAVHPLKSLCKAAKWLVRLLHALTKPETWSKMGAGIIGASLGSAVLTFNPLLLIGVGVGAALMLGGLTVGALSEAIRTTEESSGEAALKYLGHQGGELLESALTGFIIGIIFGALQPKVTPQDGWAILKQKYGWSDFGRKNAVYVGPSDELFYTAEVPRF